jgi:hypothetical protein
MKKEKPKPLHEKYPEYFSKPKPETDFCKCECHNKGVMMMHCFPCCHHCSTCNRMIASEKFNSHVEKCKNKK